MFCSHYESTKSCNLIGQEHFGLWIVNHNFSRYEFCPGKQRIVMSFIHGDHKTSQNKFHDFFYDFPWLFHGQRMRQKIRPSVLLENNQRKYYIKNKQRIKFVFSSPRKIWTETESLYFMSILCVIFSLCGSVNEPAFAKTLFWKCFWTRQINQKKESRMIFNFPRKIFSHFSAEDAWSYWYTGYAYHTEIHKEHKT